MSDSGERVECVRKSESAARKTDLKLKNELIENMRSKIAMKIRSSRCADTKMSTYSLTFLRLPLLLPSLVIFSSWKRAW